MKKNSNKHSVLYLARRRKFYPLNSELSDSEQPAETALCVLTKDGVQYLGTYHCSLFDDAGYIIQNNAKKTYTIDMEE